MSTVIQLYLVLVRGVICLYEKENTIKNKVHRQHLHLKLVVAFFPLQLPVCTVHDTLALPLSQLPVVTSQTVSVADPTTQFPVPTVQVTLSVTSSATQPGVATQGFCLS